MAPDNESYLGCDLPHDPVLTSEGWQWRCNTDNNRTREVVDTYRELGFEVRLVPVSVDGLSDSCAGCKEALCTFSAVYTRKSSGAATTG